MKYLIRHGIFLISCISSDRRNESRILKPTTRLTLHGMWISLGTFGCVEHEMVRKMKTKTHTHWE